MKKILIVCMGCQNEFFVNQEKFVKDTWAKPIIEGKYENIGFMIFRGGYDKNSYSNSEHLLKLNVEDDADNRYKKCYLAYSMIRKNFKEYDYIYRTNTSTYVNVELLNAFIQNIDNDEVLYSGEIMSLAELPAPYPLCLSCRGDSVIISAKMMDILLEYSLPFLYMKNHSEDVFTSCVLNSYWISQGKDYKDYIKSFYHGWYKCIPSNFNNGNRLCGWCNDSTDYNYWKNFISIRVRSLNGKNTNDYSDYSYRTEEEQRLNELNDIFANHHDEAIEDTVKKNIERSNDLDVFIGSTLGYISYQNWKTTSKSSLYVYEKSKKAETDDWKNKLDPKLIYVDYHYNNTKEQLI